MATTAPALATTSGVAAWGDNAAGQLGDGTKTLSSVPVAVTGLSEAAAVSGGNEHSVAMLQGGTVMAWGANSWGQLGNGTATASNVPVAVSGLSEATAVSASSNYSLALLSNGTVESWGRNDGGQLGDGTATGPEECAGFACSRTPVAVSGLSGVTAISSAGGGGGHSLALLSSGEVRAWGAGESGQLGNGSFKGSDVPVAVCAAGEKAPCARALTEVKAIAAGSNYSLAVLDDGTVVAWGENGSGQLGNGTTSSSPVPVAVTGLGGVTAVSAGKGQSLALLGSGEVRAWGANLYGQLGDGSSFGPEVCPGACSKTPVAVSGLSEVTSISAGSFHGLALLKNGTVMGWGRNEKGQLGDGTTSGPETCFGSSCSTVAVPASELSGATGIAGGQVHSLVVYTPPASPTVSGVSPSSGPQGGGTTVTITGTGFTGAYLLHFGAKGETKTSGNFRVNSPTSITATAPAEGSGIVDVTVTTLGGTSSTSAADQFTYVPPPAVTKVSPASGNVGGGTSVTITGANFTEATSVKFGSVAATSFAVNSATSITAVAPPESAGSVHIRVTTPNGTSAIANADRFKFKPTVSSVSPSTGSPSGGTMVTVTGMGFVEGATTIKFGTTPAASVSCTSWNVSEPTTESTCTVMSPAHAAGKVNVKATVNKMTSATTTADRFTYR
jgi:alpha-tubulin suppressor-like RCC1 family protein